MNEKRFQVISTEPYPYVDKSGRMVRGVLVRVHLLDYDEYHEIIASKPDTANIAKEINAFLAVRDELDQLG